MEIYTGLNGSKFSKYTNGLEVSVGDIVSPALNTRARCEVLELNSNSMILEVVAKESYMPLPYFSDDVNWVVLDKKKYAETAKNKMSFKEYINKTIESDCKITNFLNGRDFDVKITKERIRLFTKPGQLPGQIIPSFGVSYLEYNVFDNSENFIEFLFMLRDTPKEQRQDLEKKFLLYQYINK